MSKIALSPDANGTGVFTIASPNSDTSRTLTLPDDSGTIVTNSGNQAGSFTTLNTSGQVVFNDAGADVDFRVEGDTNANLLFVDASADAVGIGTNSPSGFGSDTVLAVYDATTPRIKLQNSTTGSANTDGAELNMSSSDFIIENREAGNIRLFNNGSERMRIDSSGNLLVGTTTAPSSTGIVGVLARGGSSYIQFTKTNATAGGYAVGTDGTALLMYSHTGTVGSESYTERMRIASSGNVGIGTSSPASAIHAKGSGVPSGFYGNVVATFEDSSNDYPAITFKGTSGELFALRTPGSGGLVFADTSSGSSFLQRMVIDSSGRVTTPYQPSFKAGRNGTQTYSAGQAIVFNSEFYDIGSNYDSSTGVFTAPVSGTYLFTATVLVQGSSTGNEFDLLLNTSNSSYFGAPGRIEYQLGTAWGDGYIAVGAYHLAYMDVNDTAWIGFSTFGGGQIYGGTTWTNFAGMLMG